MIRSSQQLLLISLYVTATELVAANKGKLTYQKKKVGANFSRIFAPTFSSFKPTQKELLSVNLAPS